MVKEKKFVVGLFIKTDGNPLVYLDTSITKEYAHFGDPVPPTHRRVEVDAPTEYLALKKAIALYTQWNHDKRIYEWRSV